MFKRIFNIKNFVRAIVFAVLTFLLHCLVDFIFGDEIQWNNSLKSSAIMSIVFFLIGVDNLSWKEMFFGKKMRKENQNFVQNPSKMTLIIFTAIFLLVWSMLYYGLRDDKGEFQFNLVVGFLLMSNVIVLMKLYFNYFNNRKNRQSDFKKKNSNLTGF